MKLLGKISNPVVGRITSQSTNTKSTSPSFGSHVYALTLVALWLAACSTHPKKNPSGELPSPLPLSFFPSGEPSATVWPESEKMPAVSSGGAPRLPVKLSPEEEKTLIKKATDWNSLNQPEALSTMLSEMFLALNTVEKQLTHLSSQVRSLQTTLEGEDLDTPSARLKPEEESESSMARWGGASGGIMAGGMKKLGGGGSEHSRASSSGAFLGHAKEPARLEPGGFIDDAAVQHFRQAMLLYRGEKTPEAMLEFAAFVEKYPDHTLAGSAQFYLGDGYLHLKEYRLAIRELQQGLERYPRSHAASLTLKDLILAERALGLTEEAREHAEQLTLFYPQSPAGAWLRQQGAQSQTAAVLQAAASASPLPSSMPSAMPPALNPAAAHPLEERPPPTLPLQAMPEDGKS